MKFKVAICDDDEKDRDILQEYLLLFQMKHDVDFETEFFAKGRDLLGQYNQAGVYDVLFLDVEMPGFSGLEIAEQIRRLPDKRARILFVSNYPKYMQDSFNVQAYQYLQKPLGYTEFEKQMNRIIEDVKESYLEKMLIDENNKEELVALDDIFCVETIQGKKGLLKVVLRDGVITAKGQMNEWEKELTKYQFVSPYRGILVNLDVIHFFYGDTLELLNGQKVPLSRRKEKEVRNRFSKRIITVKR